MLFLLFVVNSLQTFARLLFSIEDCRHNMVGMERLQNVLAHIILVGYVYIHCAHRQIHIHACA